MATRSTFVWGVNLVGGKDAEDGSTTLQAVNPITGNEIPPAVREATEEEVRRAAELAAETASWFAELHPVDRAKMLSSVAQGLDDHADQIIELAHQETGLSVDAQLTGEHKRTVDQLRFLGEVVEEGSYLEAILDVDPSTDLRRWLTPIGPVAVFGASNFPLAFSVAGGDTAASLAVGCPVVVKAHRSHPRTSEATARVVANALQEADAPSGIFSTIHGFDAGRRLVANENIRAVAFRGSFAGGRAMMELASKRPNPIPVYAEMGSLNPVVISPRAAANRRREVAAGFVESFTLGLGQFCTKPGLLFVPSTQAEEFMERVGEELNRRTVTGPLLNRSVHAGWVDMIDTWEEIEGVEGHSVVHRSEASKGDGLFAHPVTVTTDVSTFLQNAELREECFGPAAVVVRYDGLDDLMSALQTLEGNLVASIHASSGDSSFASAASRLLAERAGRIVWNGWPTGVAVTWAMHHGGPYPATSNPLHTSVGATSLRRFLRPIAYQQAPEDVLPPALSNRNPCGIPRRVNGESTRSSLRIHPASSGAIQPTSARSMPESDRQPQVFIEPRDKAQIRRAVREAGGEVVRDVAEASVVVWLDKDPARLEPLLHARIRWIQLPSAGVRPWIERGIVGRTPVVTSAARAYPTQLAEHALTLTLCGLRSIHPYARSRAWNSQPVRSLAGATVGVYGAGGIGRHFLSLIQPFNVASIAVNRSGTRVPEAEGTLPSSRINEFWERSEVLVLSAPSTPETERVVNRDSLAKLPDHAFIVNVARGELVDTEELTDALARGDIWGAALDVTDPEPLPDDHPLWSEQRALITCHGGNPRDAVISALSERVAENVGRYRRGQELLGTVDVHRGY